MSVKTLTQPQFIPMSRAEMDRLGWQELDILLVSGDAYVDHPSFASALLGRFLISQGWRVGIVAQPRWTTTEDLLVMGVPRLAVGVGAGALDSMLAHYTAFRKKRHDDAYTPGGQCGARPNRALIVYSNLVRQAFPGKPVIIGGLEASLRRITHYDFWSDSLRRSILLDSKANLLVYGMGETALAQAMRHLEEGLPLEGIPGTVWCASREHSVAIESAGQEILELPSHEAMLQEKPLLIKATVTLEQHVHRADIRACQRVGERTLILEPPAIPLSQQAMDALYDLPFSKRAHPRYDTLGPIPAVEMIGNSINTHRGCGGGCSFCSLALHQGRRVASRSRESIMREAQRLNQVPGFHGSVSDVGGPSANMWQARCTADTSKCRRASCLHPQICPHFKVDQRQYVDLLRQVRNLPHVKHVRVASGIRYDLALQDEKAVQAYTAEFTGGQLKIAPEHVCPEVLNLMRKPPVELLEKFVGKFQNYSRQASKEQYVIPYLISAFPGCTEDHMRELSRWLKERHWLPQQVQCFIPTPGTVATAMFYAQQDTQGHPLFVATSDAQRLCQHGYIAPSRRDKPSGHPRPDHQTKASQSSARRPVSPGRSRPNRRKR